MSMSMSESKAVALGRWLRKFASKCNARAPRQLRLCETLGLGERRFLAVVQFEQQKFLIGGTGNSVALLTRLGAGDFESSFLPEVPRIARTEAEHREKQPQGQ
jgi:flagellar biogenesis protein FliO